MKMNLKAALLPTVLMILLHLPVQSTAQINVKVFEDEAYLYHQPDTNSSPRIVAQKGDIFEVRKTEGEWLQIHLFSGKTWYIKNSKAQVIIDTPAYPSDPSTRNELCIQAKKAQKKASEKAMANYPVDINMQTLHEKVHFDKYLLESFRNFGIPASHYAKLVECVNNGMFRMIKMDS